MPLILKYRADALNCLYFDGDARGLEPFIVQNNLLFECIITINGCATKNQVRIAAGFKLFLMVCLNLLLRFFCYLFGATSSVFDI